MIALWIGLGVYLGIAIAALVPAVCFALLSGRDENVYQTPFWALFWPVSLVIVIRANWKVLRRK